MIEWFSVANTSVVYVYFERKVFSRTVIPQKVDTKIGVLFREIPGSFLLNLSEDFVA